MEEKWKKNGRKMGMFNRALRLGENWLVSSEYLFALDEEDMTKMKEVFIRFVYIYFIYIYIYLGEREGKKWKRTFSQSFFVFFFLIYFFIVRVLYPK